jgi:Uma2 family endonuclease
MTKRIEPRFFFNTIDWTLEQYHSMVAAGVLTENDRVELLYGKIVPMSPVGRYHAACVSNIQEFFILSFGKKFTWRTQDPVAMLDNSEPEPDFIIAVRDENNYAEGHPTRDDILVLMEVSDSTLDKDREHKLPIYAEGGVKEYWIINLVERQFEIYTVPNQGGTYGEQAIHQEGSTFEHKLLGTIEVSELLPGIISARK